LKDKPIAIRFLGEDLVLFRGENGKAAALLDRCPHRGTMLSRGRMIFPGTLSCGYHGWTFNGKGECVAAIVEGPESRLPRKVTVRSYPVEERFGIVWVYMGEGEPPRLEEDLPPELLEPGVLFQFTFEEWKCDWRNVTENYPDMLHALFVHRRSWEMVFQKIPAWGNMVVKPLPDGKGLFVQGPGKEMQAEYPQLGKFPRNLWWRILSRRTPGGVGAAVRMPGYIVLARRREPYWGFLMTGWQWPMPIEENRALILEATITHQFPGAIQVPFLVALLLQIRPSLVFYPSRQVAYRVGELPGSGDALFYGCRDHLVAAPCGSDREKARHPPRASQERGRLDLICLWLGLFPFDMDLVRGAICR
jgi:nitrite reductase/ring-hydroxylating ferredoxin subunit